MAIPQPILDVHAQRPELLRANTHQADAHFLWFCCQAMGPDWRLLSKSTPENGYTWPNGIRTSHDAICRVNGEEQKVQCVDIIAGAGSGQPASPAWIDIPPHEWRPSNLPVKLSQVPAPPGSVPLHTCRLGVSFFPALGLRRHDRARYNEAIQFHRDVLKANYARVVYYLADEPWRIVGTGHIGDAERRDLLKAVIEDLLAAGVAPQLTVFGSWIPNEARLADLVEQFKTVVRPYASQIFLVDAFNEPGRIGVPSYAPVREVTRRLSDLGVPLLSPASPNSVHMGVNGRRATDAEVAADVEALIVGLPTAVNALTPHWGRNPWEQNRPLGAFAVGKKIVNDEGRGIESSVAAIGDPADFANDYLADVKAGVVGYTLHGEPGVWHGYCEISNHPEWKHHNSIVRWQDVLKITEIVAALHQVRADGSAPIPSPQPPPQEFPVFPYPNEQAFWHESGSYGSQVKAAYREAFERGLRPSPDPDWNAFVWYSRPGWMIAAGQANAEQAAADNIAELRRQLGL